MFSLIRNSRWAGAPLGAIVVLAMWGNAMAGIFCPHMSGHDCCMSQQFDTHAKPASNDLTPPPEGMDMDHKQMSDAGMEDSSMDMTEAPTSAPDSKRTSEIQIPTRTAADEQVIAGADEPCPHCMMHSRAGERFPVSIFEANTSDQISPAETPTSLLNTFVSPRTIVELHDHGPPGSAAPLYVLVSAFRI